MDPAIASLIYYMGNTGLYSALVGLAVMLLMPERSGVGFGGAIAALGIVAMGSELILAHTII